MSCPALKLAESQVQPWGITWELSPVVWAVCTRDSESGRVASVRGPAGFSGGVFPQLSDEAARRKPARPVELWSCLLLVRPGQDVCVSGRLRERVPGRQGTGAGGGQAREVGVGRWRPSSEVHREPGGFASGVVVGPLPARAQSMNQMPGLWDPVRAPSFTCAHNSLEINKNLTDGGPAR